MTYTNKIVEYITNSRKESIPEEVTKRAKILILDSIGCAIGGYCTSVGKHIASMAKGFQGAGQASIIGDGSKVSMPFACWANSSLINILDMDDTFAEYAHQANCLIGSALGLGEARQSTGMEVIRAIVLGFEVGSRVGFYVQSTPGKHRIFPSSWQVFDAVTVAGTLLDLDAEDLLKAFGLAGTAAPLPLDPEKAVERPIGFCKNVYGWSTLTGVFWTLFAEKGPQGAPHIFDGDAGFWRLLGSDRRNFEFLVAGLGEKYNILETRFKPYPSCIWGHSSIDAAKMIFEEETLPPESIKAISIKSIVKTVQYLSEADIETVFDAQFSLPHAIAMVALRKKPGPEWISEENIIGNLEAAALRKRIRVELDPLAEEVFLKENGLVIPSSVEVETVDGKKYVRQVRYSKGTPSNPFTEEDLKEKFVILSAELFGQRKTEEIIETVESLDKLDDISLLMRLLSKK